LYIVADVDNFSKHYNEIIFH